MRSTLFAYKMRTIFPAATGVATFAHTVAAIAAVAYYMCTNVAYGWHNVDDNSNGSNNYYYNNNFNGHTNAENNNNDYKKNNDIYNSSTIIVTMDENLTTSLAATATMMTAATIKFNSEDAILSYEDGEMDPATIYVPPSQRPETYIITVLFTLIFIVGVLGNGTLVIIFFRHRSMRNIPNTYILSLALADLLVIIICVPMATIVYTQESWTFGVDLCRVSEFFKDISIGVSVFTLTALSGERYCAIVNPLRKLQTKPLTVFTATMIWLLAIFLGTPSFIVSDIDEIYIDSRNFTILVCTPFGKNGTNTETYAKYTVISKACIYYLLPLSIIGALYILMAKRLHMSAREMPGEALGVQSRSQARARRHVARMVVAFVVVFFACFFPYHLFELWFHLNPTAMDDFDDFWHAIRIIGFCTSFLHSCVNPVTLYCISGVFRTHFNRYLCCLCVRKPSRLRQHSTATAMIDTSVMSIRRSNTATNYNRGSLYVNSGVGGVGGGSGSGAAGGGFPRKSSLQRGSMCTNNIMGSKHGGNSGNGISIASANRSSSKKMAQSFIVSDKR